MAPGVTYAALFGSFLLEGTSLPVPAELVCIVSGKFIEAGEMSFWASVACAALGNVTGGLIAYLLGIFARQHLERGSRIWRVLGVTPAALRRSDDWFRRYGAITTFVARWFGPIRPAALLGAGMSRMGIPSYLGCSLAGAGSYCALWQYIGWRMAPLARRVMGQHPLWGILVLVLSLGFGVLVLRFAAKPSSILRRLPGYFCASRMKTGGEDESGGVWRSGGGRRRRNDP